MQTAHRFKLIPSVSQKETMVSWLGMLRGMVNYSLADRIDSYTQGFIWGNFCSLWSKSEACPLTCSVIRSASNGDPWKEDKPSRRRGRSDKSFNPRRSAYEVQSSGLKSLKQVRPWYKGVNADVLQQALRHLDTAFNRFFQGKARFPKFRNPSNFNSFEFKPGTVKVNGNHITFPKLGKMRFFMSRDIPKLWEIRIVTLTHEVDGWYASILLRDDRVPDLPKKSIDELQVVNGVDRGIKKIMAMADGVVEPNPQNGLYLKVKCQAAKLGNWVMEVAAWGSSQECSHCGYTSPTNRNKEKFVCELCAHHDDADVGAAVVIAQRTRNLVGLPTLPLVRRKVMPSLESTGPRKKERSLPMGGEPGNQPHKEEQTGVLLQLSLFNDLLKESESSVQST